MSQGNLQQQQYKDASGNIIQAFQHLDDGGCVGVHALSGQTGKPNPVHKCAVIINGASVAINSTDYVLTKADGTKQVVVKATFEAAYSKV